MNVYTTDKIRNVVLLGHGGSGKTSLVEAMAYLSGITSRMGKVSDGNTVSDYGKEEQKRQISISTSVIPVEWDHSIPFGLLHSPSLPGMEHDMNKQSKYKYYSRVSNSSRNCFRNILEARERT